MKIGLAKPRSTADTGERAAPAEGDLAGAEPLPGKRRAPGLAVTDGRLNERIVPQPIRHKHTGVVAKIGEPVGSSRQGLLHQFQLQSLYPSSDALPVTAERRAGIAQGAFEDLAYRGLLNFQRSLAGGDQVKRSDELFGLCHGAPMLPRGLLRYGDGVLRYKLSAGPPRPA